MKAKRLIASSAASLMSSAGAGQRITLDVERELLAVARSIPVVGHQHDEARLRQEVVVPAIRDRVAPHVRVPAVDEDEERILLRLVEVRRQRDEVVDAAAVAAREPELAQRLPVDRLGGLGCERGQERAVAGGRIDADDLDRPDRALPVGERDRRRSSEGICRFVYTPCGASTASFAGTARRGTA